MPAKNQILQRLPHICHSAKYELSSSSHWRTGTEKKTKSTIDLSQHINEITPKAHKRANSILGCFASRDVSLLVRAFTVYVRPILEYNSVIIMVAVPEKKKSLKLKKVHWRFTKRLRKLRNVEYTERLNRFGLPTLELRRLQLDLIFVTKSFLV